jgi:CubicO group peptidase (beta-lactamase class C family)
MTEIKDLLDAARADVDNGTLPACQLAVARNGELEVFETFGDATDATRFFAFSATKPIVASALWLFMGDGTIDVSRRVADYIPEFATKGKDAITVEQVLLHTAGFPLAEMRPQEGADAVRRRERFRSWQLEWEPGTKFEYHATSAHWVIADLIERCSGIDYRDFVEQRICKPLGLPRVLGLHVEQQHDIATLHYISGEPDDLLELVASPDAIAAGVPGGGAVLTAADMARFYQGVMHNPGNLWDPAVLDDVTTNVRCVFPDPLLNVPANRTLGLVVAGDDGQHFMRYGSFGVENSPRSYGHAGAHMQIAWGDPQTGISFSYMHNGLDADMLKEGARGVALSGLAAGLNFS